jgi:hypothetical protein
MTPEMAKMATDSVSRMSPEEIKRMAEMAATIQQPPSASLTSQTMTDAALAANNATSLSRQQAMQVGSSSSSAHAIPTPPAMTPEMIKMASEMMSKMTPEDMQKVTQMASGMGLGMDSAATTGMDMPALTPEMAKMVGGS